MSNAEAIVMILETITVINNHSQRKRTSQWRHRANYHELGLKQWVSIRGNYPSKRKLTMSGDILGGHNLSRRVGCC